MIRQESGYKKLGMRSMASCMTNNRGIATGISRVDCAPIVSIQKGTITITDYHWSWLLYLLDMLRNCLISLQPAWKEPAFAQTIWHSHIIMWDVRQVKVKIMGYKLSWIHPICCLSPGFLCHPGPARSLSQAAKLHWNWELCHPKFQKSSKNHQNITEQPPISPSNGDKTERVFFIHGHTAKMHQLPQLPLSLRRLTQAARACSAGSSLWLGVVVSGTLPGLSKKNIGMYRLYEDVCTYRDTRHIYICRYRYRYRCQDIFRYSYSFTHYRSGISSWWMFRSVLLMRRICL